VANWSRHCPVSRSRTWAEAQMKIAIRSFPAVSFFAIFAMDHTSSGEGARRVSPLSDERATGRQPTHSGHGDDPGLSGEAVVTQQTASQQNCPTV
jgi:hypothetical protein